MIDAYLNDIIESAKATLKRILSDIGKTIIVNE